LALGLSLCCVLLRKTVVKLLNLWLLQPNP
jgi:hypothetical protein